MGSDPPELSLDCRPTFVPKPIRDFTKEISTIEIASERECKLNEYIRRLEEEMRKIDAFKRELPLCMVLLDDAISTIKESSLKCEVSKAQPHMEEFMPLKRKTCDEDEEKNKKEKESRDKKNWMSSVQLWNTDDYPKQKTKFETKRKEEEIRLGTEGLYPSCRIRDEAKKVAFLPFKAYASAFPLKAVRKEEYQEELPSQGLSLHTPGIEESASSGSRSSGIRAASSAVANNNNKYTNIHTSFRTGPHNQSARKQRRCWAPELHRRFVSALQQLGGPQVATPKQIRELMQVDGLTNDEVKSHLQKYRLHHRRVLSSSGEPGNQSMVVLGSLWMSQDQYGDSSKGSNKNNYNNSQSGSPESPLQLTAGTGGTSVTGGDGLEDEEDAKSENYGWKNSHP